MDSEELRELQDPASWEDGEDEVRPPVKAPRAVVSVAFARDDFQQVAEYARQHGMKTSEFIRHAALEHVSPKGMRSPITSVSGTVRTGYPPVMGSGVKVKVRTPPTAAYATA